MQNPVQNIHGIDYYVRSKWIEKVDMALRAAHSIVSFVSVIEQMIISVL